ncbi:hypothetical protein G9A89_008278 [Geosiphon pyriformis]|nr:hypothetical protein G9A89_008278 [Geosiphon pyriformis]
MSSSKDTNTVLSDEAENLVQRGEEKTQDSPHSGADFLKVYTQVPNESENLTVEELEQERSIDNHILESNPQKEYENPTNHFAYESNTDSTEKQDLNVNLIHQSALAFSASAWQAVWDENVQAFYYWNTLTNETTWEVPSNYINTVNATTNQESSIENAANNAHYPPTTGEAYYNDYYSQYGYYPEAYYAYDTSSSPTVNAVESTNPLDTLLDKIDTEIKSKLDGTNSVGSTSFSSVSETYVSPDGTIGDHYQDPAAAAENAADYDTFLAQHGIGGDYTLKARFNSRTGRFQRDPTLNPERFSADSKAVRQMSYFFDYESFSQERGAKRLKGDGEKNKKLTKRQLEVLKQKKKEKKEMRKKAWLMGDD